MTEASVLIHPARRRAAFKFRPYSFKAVQSSTELLWLRASFNKLIVCVWKCFLPPLYSTEGKILTDEFRDSAPRLKPLQGTGYAKISRFCLCLCVTYNSK